MFNAERWWHALADCGIDTEAVLHRTEPLDARLPWDHINVRKGRTFLEKEQSRAVLQLAAMATATSFARPSICHVIGYSLSISMEPWLTARTI